MNEKDKYLRKKWLGEISSTSSVVAFHGPAAYGYGDKPSIETFLEISDCSVKARLHHSKFETKDQYISKLNILRDEISKFIKHLKDKP